VARAFLESEGWYDRASSKIRWLEMLARHIFFSRQVAVCTAALLGCLADTAAAYEDGTVPLLTLRPTVVCNALESSCKLRVRVAQSFPRNMVASRTTVPVECIAEVVVGFASRVREVPSTYKQIADVPITNGAVDQDIDVNLMPPAGSTSLQFKSVGCVALFSRPVPHNL
jgi:hypothetical protein